MKSKIAFATVLMLILGCAVFVLAQQAAPPANPSGLGISENMPPEKRAQIQESMERAMAQIAAVRSTWVDAIDIYMAGTDMKQPTFSNVLILSVNQLPGGVFYTGRDAEDREIVINSSQIAYTRTVGKPWTGIPRPTRPTRPMRPAPPAQNAEQPKQ